MSNLCYNSTPAERARGCVFAEKFESATHVAKNRGTVVESAPGNVKIDFGVTFPGVNGNYVSYQFSGKGNSGTLSWLVECWPYFAADDGLTHHFCAGAAGASISIVKSLGNTLDAGIGATTFFSIALGTYQNYWLQNKRNVITVTATSTGANVMYLNGNNIGSNATAWTVVDPATFYIGSSNTGTDTFLGRYGMVKVFQNILTAQEVYDYYHNRVF